MILTCSDKRTKRQKQFMKKIAAYSDETLEKRIKKLLDGPECPEKEFTLPGYTYGEIYEMASHLQEAFSSGNLSSKPICLSSDDRSVVMAALLAVMASGGPPVIIPYSDSKNVLSEMHEQTGYETAVCDGEKEFPPGVSAIKPAPGKGGKTTLAGKTEIDLNRELLLLFTGGSTGKPRIWTKTVKNLFAEVFYHIERHAISSGDRFVATVPPYHIYGLLFSVLVPFAASAAIDRGSSTFPHEIVSAIRKHDATMLVSVPMHYKALCSHPVQGRSLRLALSSAGVLDKADNDQFCAQNKTGILEIYGSTETGGIAFRCRADGEDAFSPFDHVDLKIEGETIFVRSDYISPKVPTGPDGYFRTGDAGRLLEGRRFQLSGRTDGIVKIGGKRVDLQEIREKMLRIKGVKDAAVLSTPAPAGRENEIAAAIEGDVTVSEVRSYLAKHLEPYAQPRRYKIVSGIPRNRLGKIDMKQVESMFHS